MRNPVADINLTLTCLLIASILLLFWTSGRDNSQRLTHIERKVDLLLARLEINPNQGVNQEILELMRSGQKIEAIKRYRELTEVGLKEAKDYVEGLTL